MSAFVVTLTRVVVECCDVVVSAPDAGTARRIADTITPNAHKCERKMTGWQAGIVRPATTRPLRAKVRHVASRQK